MSFSSVDKQLLVIWVIRGSADNQLQMLVRLAACGSNGTSNVVCTFDH